MTPMVSIVIPTFNEQAHIRACLESIMSQAYPKRRLDVIVVDNYSEDQTVRIAKQFPVRVIKRRRKDAQYLKMQGLRVARGAYFLFMDADNRLPRPDWMKQMIALHKDPSIVGSFTHTTPDPADPLLSQYFASFSFYASPLYAFFSTRVEKTIVEDRGAYMICRYTHDRVPPTGSCVYKMKYLKAAGIHTQEKFMELDVLYHLLDAGYDTYAFHPHLGLYHTHITQLSQIFPKRKRNLERNYLSDISIRRFTWVDFGRMRSKLRIMLWVIYTYTLLGPIVRGLVKTIQTRKIFMLFFEPVVTLVETTAVIVGVLGSHDRQFFVKQLLPIHR